MRYVGSLKKENNNYDNIRKEKAVFPPGSIIPGDMNELAESASHYNENNSGKEQCGKNTVNDSRFSDGEALFPLKNNDNQSLEGECGEFSENSAGTYINSGSYAGEQLKPPMSFQNNMGFIYENNSVKGCASNRSLNDFLCAYMGKYISAEFLFGADTYVKKSGILTATGMNYIVLNVNGNTVVCDMTDARFINISTDDLI